MVGCPILMSQRNELATRAVCLACDKHTKSRVEAISRPFPLSISPTYPTNPNWGAPSDALQLLEAPRLPFH